MSSHANPEAQVKAGRSLWGPGCPVLWRALQKALEQGRAQAFPCGWRPGIQLAELSPLLSRAPGWEMIHENQEGKISPKATE